MKLKTMAISALASSLILAGCQTSDKPQTLAASGWPAAEREKYMAIEGMAIAPSNPEATGEMGAVTGSFHGYAQRAGLEALKQGGTSADAAMTTALTQVALGAGAVISYFGIMSVVHYDAASGEVSYMNASWDTVRGEKDPMSIPGRIDAYGEGLYGHGEPSGRTALVGGFMKGVEAMNERFGKLPFARLFEPSIEIAEQGVPFTQNLMKYLEPRRNDLARLPETKAVFTNEKGEWVKEGELFKQPALAKTLRAVANQGADYMYTGPWAKKLVEKVQAEGGFMTLEDLANYEVIWGEPLVGEHNGHQVYLNGKPAYGGVHAIEALHLSKAAKIKELGHWSKSAESFKHMANLLNNGNITFLEAAMPDVVKQMLPGVDTSIEGRLKPENAEKIWKLMQAGVPLAQWADTGTKHSDTVVAVDQWGNMTAVTHTINCVVWGKTGIFVDGVSIGDPAVSQKAIIAKAGPGTRLPDPTEQGLVFKDGAPVLAFTSMSMGLHLETAQSLINYMDFGMSPKEASDAPSMLYPKIDMDWEKGTATQTVRVMKGAFSKSLLDQTGLPYLEIEPKERRLAQGLWAGIERDPKTGKLKAASHKYTTGQAVAY